MCVRLLSLLGAFMRVTRVTLTHDERKVDIVGAVGHDRSCQGNQGPHEGRTRKDHSHGYHTYHPVFYVIVWAN